MSHQVDVMLEEQTAGEAAAAPQDESPEAAAAAKDKAERAKLLATGSFNPAEIRKRDKIVSIVGVIKVR